MIYRSGVGDGDEISINKNIRILGTGAITQNILQVFGSVRIMEQYFIIKSITSLNNATNLYADAHDGTDTELLTADGAILSGCMIDSMFTKDLEDSQIFSVCDCSQVRVNEITKEKYIGKPFIVTQKRLENTFIRLHLTTSDTPIDFILGVLFKFQRLGIGSNLVFV